MSDTERNLKRKGRDWDFLEEHSTKKQRSAGEESMSETSDSNDPDDDKFDDESPEGLPEGLEEWMSKEASGSSVNQVYVHAWRWSHSDKHGSLDNFKLKHKDLCVELKAVVGKKGQFLYQLEQGAKGTF